MFPDSTVINPAKLDDADGKERPFSDLIRRDLLEILQCSTTHMFLLANWEHSRGAVLEMLVGQALELTFYEQDPGDAGLMHFREHTITDVGASISANAMVKDPTLGRSEPSTLSPKPNIFPPCPYTDMYGPSDDADWATEAQYLVNHDRGPAYGHPYNDFSRQVALLKAWFGDRSFKSLQPEDIAIMMILVKLARERNAHKDDNIIDVIGYALTLEKVLAKRVDLEKKNGSSTQPTQKPQATTL